MPTTYSSKLRLSLMATGENSGTWGNVTNTNLGTLLEQAIAGVASVSMSDANKTLTALDGSSDESRNAVITLTGTLSATRNVIVPSTAKVYVVRNSTSGGQSIVVKTAAGTGVTITNGSTATVYCDGTNVVAASVPVNASTGSAAVAGDLAVTGNITVDGTLTGASVFTVPTGTVLEFAGSAAPTGYLLCDGSAVSRTTYASLFAVIGTAYGAGNGSTTFNVPDRRDKVSVGAGSTYTRGATGGSATATTSSNGSHNHTGAVGGTALTVAQMPSHSHTGSTSFVGDHAHDIGSVFHSLAPGAAGLTFAFPTGGTGWTGAAGAHSHTLSIDAAGSGATHNHTIGSDGAHTHTVSTIQPYVASNFIIKT